MTSAPLEALAQQAPFIFRGLLLSTGTSATASVAATDRTAVVRVIEVIRAPNAFQRLAGQNVTVNLVAAGQPEQGATVIFFARLHTAADTIAVDEISHQPLPTATATAEGLYDAMAAQQDSRLSERLQKASAVVVGTVSNVRPSVAAAATSSEQPAHVSEHDPQWSEAVVAVQSVVKGQAADTVVIVFPASIDVRWYRAPKFHAGQRGVFLLHSEAVPAAAAAQYADVYTALDVPDVLPVEEQSRVRALLANSP